ncbi:xylose isomerase-like [Plodia interpunctella]|uniref:xylose isomerase-like n=1 Tax=Plodia interpunctella TaxID=58824 RepID=UPI002368B8BA|nr:xylose isomerase-like [Plodia interpunctella]XP_053606999.1 xylose isomerase-like [Plodia interpunctella]XP_053607000.1 xylose isomerase-like [Plodia interpunctella]
MSSYSQPGAKRQKRPERPDVDYFQGIDKLEYNNMAGPGDTNYYRYYNGTERVANRNMEDWLKFSVSLTEFRNYDYDHSFRSSHRQWDDGTCTIDNYKHCLKALFDLCSKLGVKYWTAYDSDLVPPGDSWDETRAQWDEMVEYIQELSQKFHMKLLWLAPNLHSNPRYSLGALTSSDATVYAQAATQIKKCLEVSQRLSAECFLLWPSREGYSTIFHADIAKEMKLFSKLLKLTAEYKDRLNYRCQLLLMPYYRFGRNYGGWQYWENEMVNMYMWDVTSCLYFLKNYNLDRYYKVCVPPGHHMFMANIYNMLGGVFLTNNFDHYDIKNLTLMMKCIIDQGSAPPGGVHLQLRARGVRPPARARVIALAARADASARALRLAAALANHQLVHKHLQERYSSYCSGFGARLAGSDVSMEECEDHYKKNQVNNDQCSRLEQLDVALQRYIYTCDQI